jgi:hypothetical protein
MANRHRGEIEVALGDRRWTLCLTLGALAELEAAYGDEDLLSLAERFERGALGARDVIRIIGAGLRGAGNDVSDVEVAALPVEGGRRAISGSSPICCRRPLPLPVGRTRRRETDRRRRGCGFPLAARHGDRARAARQIAAGVLEHDAERARGRGCGRRRARIGTTVAPRPRGADGALPRFRYGDGLRWHQVAKS